MTGAHHARELISIQMPLYSALKLLHGNVHQDPNYQALLQQNVYHFAPVINPDGLALIEEDFDKTGQKKIMPKRKNMNPRAIIAADGIKCLTKDTGVDLNRNYGVDWGEGNRAQYGGGDTAKTDECQD